MAPIRSFSKGKYAGVNTAEISLGGVLLSETAYRQDTISDWHYHEHPYFAFILDGGSKECRKTGQIECLPGHIYFYNWQDVHRNKDYQAGSRNFNVEFDSPWLAGQGIDIGKAAGTYAIDNPALTMILLRLFREYKTQDGVSELAISSLALELAAELSGHEPGDGRPPWMRRVLELLNDRWSENLSLAELSAAVSVHPVTIARYFPGYMGCTVGEYVRRLRIERSVPLIRAGELSLTTIAHHCGFADQSHFTRTFKRLTRLMPKEFRRLSG